MNEYVFEPLKRLFKRPQFVVCVVFLAICAAGLRVTANKLQVYFAKEAVPLQKPLTQMDVSKLQPYVLAQQQPGPMSEEIIEELGTREYLQWIFEDTSVSQKDPLRYVSLFVTYYTGNPDAVPHVPDVCYVGGGSNPTSKENIWIDVPDNGTDSDKLRIRVLEFDIRGGGLLGRSNRTVAYFFSANGDYECQRNAVRIRQNRLTDKYTYFSKVEINFPNAGRLDLEKIVVGVEKFARVVVPVLASDHWPDWQLLTGKEEGTEAEGTKAQR